MPLTPEEELQEYKSSFEIRWGADMRAIKHWQDATGKDHIWPDHADLCVWLLQQLDSAQALIETCEAALQRIKAQIYVKPLLSRSDDELRELVLLLHSEAHCALTAIEAYKKGEGA